MATSSPLRAGASLEEELDYYKKQYEQLETDLADFQASSKELEEQLERDIEAAEKKERRLKEQVEKLGFEVEEWKTKHKQAKAEANNAQNALQKEITTMRETTRALQLRLRDIEVANDDYERQARNTESSLEDLESKYNVAIERGVLLEEEIKMGEQEREALRIETQRLRDELSDLKVESEITQEKLRLADETIEKLRSRKPSPLAVEYLRAKSPASEASGITPLSPTASTPPPKSDTMSDAPTPPSPPLSDVPVLQLDPKTPVPEPRRSLLPDAAATPRASLHGTRVMPRHSRGPSIASSNSNPTAEQKDGIGAMRPPAPRQAKRPSGISSELPRSESLYQIKALRGRMQKIEERVQSARSKLPRTGSPRTGSALGGSSIPSSVTVRRSSKRPSASAASSLADGEDETVRRESQIHKRLSYGIPRPASSASERQATQAGADRPPSAAERRPSSRSSMASASAVAASCPGARTPLSRYDSFPARSSTAGGAPPGPSRPRSSMGGQYATIHATPRTLHRPSMSVSELRRRAEAESEEADPNMTSPSRKPPPTALPTALPTPSSRKSVGPPQLQHSPSKTLRRTSAKLGQGDGEMRPPPSRRKVSDVSDVGETY